MIQELKNKSLLEESAREIESAEREYVSVEVEAVLKYGSH